MAPGHQEIELKRLLVGEAAGDRFVAASDTIQSC